MPIPPLETEEPAEYYTCMRNRRNRGAWKGKTFRNRCNSDNHASCTHRRPVQGYSARLAVLDGAAPWHSWSKCEASWLPLQWIHHPNQPAGLIRCTPDEVFLPLRQGMRKSWSGLHRGMGRPAAGGSQLPFRMSSDENLEQLSIGNSR
jgi:hypothetical protein